MSGAEPALNITVWPAGSYIEREVAAGGQQKAVKTHVFSSWLIIALLWEEPFQKDQFKDLAKALRHSISDALSICRTAVHVMDMQAAKVDFVVNTPTTAATPMAKTRDAQGGTASTLMRQVRMMFKSSVSAVQAHARLEYVNVTQVKAFYEVRLMDELLLSGAQVAQRIDALQVYHNFAELNRRLVRTVALESPAFTDLVMLDDVGYASKYDMQRLLPSSDQRGTCVEENLLRDARHVHQYIFVFALVVSVLITCAGSTVFAVKSPSLMPSLVNPLSGPLRMLQRGG